MRGRIWEDPAAMSVVSVLGFLMNDDGDVVGAERTQVLCKLLPSIHTLTHRAILAMLISGLSNADAQIFYAEKGLKVLNAWLQDGLSKKKEPGMSKEKRRLELLSQVRALLRILDVNVQTDEARKQNSFVAHTIPKAIDLVNNVPDFAAEWSKLNIYRRHFESACNIPSTAKETRSEPPAKRPRPTPSPKASEANGAASSSTGSTRPTPTPSRTPSEASQPASTGSTSSVSSNRAAVSVLDYQPKSFLQKEAPPPTTEDDDVDEYIEDDDDEDLGAGEDVITNVAQAPINASLDNKIKNFGHKMEYGARKQCSSCHRMTAKHCEHCSNCVKCAQRGRCAPPSASSDDGGASSSGHRPATGSMTVEERTRQVLGSAMDQAVYNAFKKEDFHAAFSLIQNGTDINFQRVESDNSTVLMAAAHHGRDDAVSKLLRLGANPCVADKDGNLPWVFAERRGHKELTERLKKCADEWKASHPDTK